MSNARRSTWSARWLSAALLLSVAAGCASAPEAPRPMLGRATQAGDRLSEVVEVLAVRQEALPAGGSRVVYRVRNRSEHRVFEFRATLEQVVCETGAVTTSTASPVDYLHHGEEIDVEFDLPPDGRPPGSPTLANRLSITVL